MNLYCVKPYMMEGGFIVVAEDEKSALRLIRYMTAGKPDKDGVYREDVEPFLEALPMGLSNIQGSERLICVLKGLVDFREYAGITRSPSRVVTTSPIELPVFRNLTSLPPPGPSTPTAPRLARHGKQLKNWKTNETEDAESNDVT